MELRGRSVLVLASASPRRLDLLARLGIPVEVRPSRVDESLPPGRPLAEALEEVARRKAAAVAREVGGAWVLAADTAVVLGGRVMGKPRGRKEAREMLRALSGRVHRVVTAVALLGPGTDRTVAVETRVRFRRLSEAEIAWYTGLDEPYDKAGAYGIQGRGAFLVESIEGSYTNVVGLPLSETVDLLRSTGLLPWRLEEDEA